VRAILLRALVAGSIAIGSATVARAQAASESRAGSAGSTRLVDEAEQMIRQAGHDDPVDSAKVREAIAKLKRAVDLNPRNDSAYADLGFSYALLKDAPTAVDMYRKAVAINPSPANYKELTDIYLRTGSPENALMAANAGLSKDSRDAGLYNARGMALTNLRRYDEAGRDFRKALDLDPSLEAARVNLNALGSGYSGRGTVSRKSGTNP
jgi:tetratricopeptide (TPR) repeat protein